MLLIIIVLIHISLSIYLTIGWFKIPKYEHEIVANLKVSIVIAFRNEAKNLHNLLEDLNELTYPSDLLDIILINDHSEDESLNIVESYKLKFPKLVLNLPSELYGKKSAIKFGIQHSESELIITTDADCNLQQSWVNIIANFYQSSKANFIAAPVVIKSENSFFSKLQQIEFSSLIGSSGSLTEMNIPVMSNAANMAFNRLVYNDFQSNTESIASGDDIFLMHHIQAKFPGTIRFLKSQKASVFTKASPDLNSFIQQRLRWAGKWKYYKDLPTKLTALIVLLFNLCIIVSPFFIDFNIFLILITVKAITEFVFLKNVLALSKIEINIFSFIILVFIYPFYVVNMGIISSKNSYLWKGRIVE